MVFVNKCFLDVIFVDLRINNKKNCQDYNVRKFLVLEFRNKCFIGSIDWDKKNCFVNRVCCYWIVFFNLIEVSFFVR